MKQKNEEILEKMRNSTDEEEKLRLYDMHIAQKYIDDTAPLRRKMDIKLSNLFKSVSKNWNDNSQGGV